MKTFIDDMIGKTKKGTVAYMVRKYDAKGDWVAVYSVSAHVIVWC